MLIPLSEKKTKTKQIVQFYYAFKLSTLYKEPSRSPLVATVALFAAAQLGVAFGIVATYNTIKSPPPLFSMNVRTEVGWQTLSYLICANLIIFVASFKDARSPRFAVRSESFLQVFNRYVIETNSLATIVTILALSFCLASNNEGKQSGVWMAFALVLPKLYVWSLLASHTRGAEITRMTVDYSKHASSLSDMFKGSPVSETLKKPSSRFPVTVSKIGTPQGLSPVGEGGKTPIADLYAAGVTGGVGTSGIVEGPDSPGWLRRTVQPTITTNNPLLLEPPAPIPRSSLSPSPLSRQSAAPTSISDYGEYFAEDQHSRQSRQGGVPPLPTHAIIGGGGRGNERDQGREGGGGEGGYSTSIEISLSPRRTSFQPQPTPSHIREPGEKVMEVLPMSSGGPSVFGLTLQGRQPVTYGYM
ncbi:hypothetical protein JCM16303_003826 [Sporobolomyces ruberrimus]